MNLRDIHDQIITLVQKAGAGILTYLDVPVEQTTKGNATDIVTVADRETEALIVSTLLEQYPTHHIQGEEGGGMGADADTAEYVWYIDPLDGTTNFASKIPHFSVSIALADNQLNPLVGAVYDPNRDELYSAIKGEGAWLNGKPIHVSPTLDLGNSIVVSGFPYHKWTNPDNNLKEWSRFVVRTRGMRRTGSAALDACYVAVGRFEGYWERYINSWDIMAGALIVQEAGGKISNYKGEVTPTLLDDREIVMSNGHIHPAMVELLSAE